MIARYFLFFVLLISACNSISEKQTKDIRKADTAAAVNGKIKVLNVAVFHMGETNDLHKTEFDEKDKENIQAAQRISRLIAEFKPTVICVEFEPEYNQKLNDQYYEYVKYPGKPFSNLGEVGLIAFEVGRLCKVKNMYGIDHQMAYNYLVGEQLKDKVESETYDSYFKNPFANTPELNVNFDSLSTLEKLKLMNSRQYLDFLQNINADILAYAGTKGNFEGADEAALFYKRNLRIFSNLNQIPLTRSDRVFIILGGAHTAFLNDFMSRSPKYELVNVFDYLK